MLTRLFEDVKKTPERIRSAPTRINRRRLNATHWARQRVHTARGESQERLWTWRADALLRVDTLLDRTVELWVIGRLTSPAADYVQSAYDDFTAVPIDDYGALSVKKLAVQLRELPRLDLVRVRRVELAGKARKTLLSAIEREIDKRDLLPEALAA